MLKLAIIAVGAIGFSLAATASTAEARDGRTSAKRGGKVVYVTTSRKRSVRTTRYRTTARAAYRPQLIDNTYYFHRITPLDGKAMFDAINDLSTNDGD